MPDKNPVCFISPHPIFGDAWKLENMISISDEALEIIRKKEKGNER